MCLRKKNTQAHRHKRTLLQYRHMNWFSRAARHIARTLYGVWIFGRRRLYLFNNNNCLFYLFQFLFGMFELIGCVYFRSHVRKKQQRQRQQQQCYREHINKYKTHTSISMKAINLFAAFYLLWNRNSPYSFTNRNHFFRPEFQNDKNKKKKQLFFVTKWKLINVFYSDLFLYLDWFFVCRFWSRWKIFCMRTNCKYWTPTDISTRIMINFVYQINDHTQLLQCINDTIFHWFFFSLPVVLQPKKK